MAHKSKGISTPVEFGAERCSDVQDVSASWHYNWSPNPMHCPGDNVPMVWGWQTLEALENEILILSGNSVYVLGFNEPDIDTQANMTPGACARYWWRLENLYPGKLLVSPAPSHLDYRFLNRMRNRYITRYGEPPRFDALACHSYGSTTGMSEVLDWMDQKAAAWDVREIWVTEWGMRPPQGNVYSASVDYMHQCREIFNEYDRLTRFAWFTSRHPSWDAQCCYRWEMGEITQIGAAYRGL